MAPSAITPIEEIESKPFENAVKSSIFVQSDKHISENDQDIRKNLIKQTLRERINKIDTDTCEPGEEDTFYVADLSDVYRQHLRWKLHLNRVKPHYAVKCNPDPSVLQLLANLGTGFDCASKAEIEQILALGVSPQRIIYAQPCKTKSHIRYAAEQEVRQMTFDNTDELRKIKQFFPDAELYLRIQTDDSASLCRLSLKFGASLENTQDLLALARELGLNVVGVAFHVGSGASDPSAYTRAVADARFVFNQAAELGYDLRNLDVGGGFVSDSFEEMAVVLSAALEEHFPPHVRVIGEPGRFYVSTAFTLACCVIARRTVEDPATGEKSYMLYLNDGVYGNFSSIMFDHQHPVAKVLKCSGPESNIRRPVEYSIWGPTCDGIDCISASCVLDRVIDVGDWLYFEDMGAYTKCSATRFNGFSNNHDVIYITTEPSSAAFCRFG